MLEFKVGLLSSGIKPSEVFSWLDQYPNQVKVKEICQEIVVSYDDGSCKIEVRSFVIVGSGRAKHSLSLL